MELADIVWLFCVLVFLAPVVAAIISLWIGK